LKDSKVVFSEESFSKRMVELTREKVCLNF